MRDYELAVVFSTQTDSEVLKERMKAIVTENGGSNFVEDDWGVRKLAYPIEKQSDGYYYFLKFSAEPFGISGMKKSLRLEEFLLRYLILADEHKHVFKRKDSRKTQPSTVVDEIKKEIPETNAVQSENSNEIKE